MHYSCKLARSISYLKLTLFSRLSWRGKAVWRAGKTKFWNLKNSKQVSFCEESVLIVFLSWRLILEGGEFRSKVIWLFFLGALVRPIRWGVMSVTFWAPEKTIVRPVIHLTLVEDLELSQLLYGSKEYVQTLPTMSKFTFILFRCALHIFALKVSRSKPELQSVDLWGSRVDIVFSTSIGPYRRL